jgi:predicted transcriptional regulator
MSTRDEDVEKVQELIHKDKHLINKDVWKKINLPQWILYYPEQLTSLSGSTAQKILAALQHSKKMHVLLCRIIMPSSY